MRVVKAAQFGIQSALIGGAFVLLGGAALADTSTQPATNPTSPLAQSGANVKDTTGNSTTVTNNGQGTVNVSNTTNTNDQSGSNSQGGTTLISGDQNNNSNTPTGTVSNNGSLPGPTGQNAILNNQNSQGNNPTVTNPAPKLDQDTTLAQPVSAPATPQSSTTTEQPALPAPVVFFQSKPLRIQPVIVTSNVADMASALPSLPTPASAPVPPKPNSALGHLSAVLADTIVPVFFFLISAPVRSGLATIVFATFIILLLGAFISNYGLWLRRGGFATAARSDAPTPSNFSPFATPQFLGYVFAPPRFRHSPVFVVAEIKTGGYSLRGL